MTAKICLCWGSPRREPRGRIPQAHWQLCDASEGSWTAAVEGRLASCLFGGLAGTSISHLTTYQRAHGNTRQTLPTSWLFFMTACRCRKAGLLSANYRTVAPLYCLRGRASAGIVASTAEKEALGRAGKTICNAR